jgi:membrane dipeptidase
LKKHIFFIGLGSVLFGCISNPESIENKARKIHEKAFTVDSHTDSPWYLLEGNFDMNQRHEFEKGGSRLDFPRMKEGGQDAVFFGAFVGQRARNEEGNLEAKQRVITTIDSIHVHLEGWKETAGLALNPDEAYKLEKEGKRAIFIGIENGYAIGNELANIDEFYQKGARYITLFNRFDGASRIEYLRGRSGQGNESCRDDDRHFACFRFKFLPGARLDKSPRHCLTFLFQGNLR